MIAQLELWNERKSGRYENKVYVLPKHLDEKVGYMAYWPWHIRILSGEWTLLFCAAYLHKGGGDTAAFSDRECLFSTSQPRTQKTLYGSPWNWQSSMIEPVQH